MESINYKSIERYAKKIERENLKNNGTSLSWVSMLRSVNVICVHHGSNLVDVDGDYKEQLNIHKAD